MFMVVHRPHLNKNRLAVFRQRGRTMNKTHIGAVGACILAAFTSMPTGAALIDRGGGLIYDTDQNITWLADANYARTSGYDANGSMDWSQAMTWAANLSYYDSVRNVTYDDWRLPTTLQRDTSCGFQYGVDSYGYNCTGSELGHLFYSELGGVAYQSIVTTHDADYNLFTNVESSDYWSATEYAPNPSYAWRFVTSLGYQGPSYKSNSHYAWAVRDGDVYAASVVPAPAAAWLFVSGLLPLFGYLRK